MPAPPNPNLERQSSAMTLSDMEVFIFPELLYALLLANIMSPRLWTWRDDPWFSGIARMSPYRRIARVKQYIMDHYVFNLDLDTWGLTTKEAELARFADFVSPEALARSNALFGYEGDKYYFDLDIRTHFGLEKYGDNVIPYWKTETVEAMDAFRHKPNYATGAGECVSLSTLYAAALFVVAHVPLRSIYLMATPLHSQNFIDHDDGILTNNRRLVTKRMWFNGTALSAQARRALENEQVTIVAHESGHIHALYPDATVDPRSYEHFRARLSGFLFTDLTSEILGSFLRHEEGIQKCFQMRWPLHGIDHYVAAERLFAYEHGSPNLVTDNTREKLMAEVETEEFQAAPLPRRIVLNELEEFVRREKLDLHSERDVARLKEQFASDCLNAEIALQSLINFCHVRPRLPDAAAKRFVSPAAPLGIETRMNRAEIMRRIEDLRPHRIEADLAFYAYRDLNRIDPEPFLHAAVRRSPVSLLGAGEAATDPDPESGVKALVDRLRSMPDESIYDEDGRLAQPDEVWNFGRGDGAEKAVLLAALLRCRWPSDPMSIEVTPTSATLATRAARFDFDSRKGLRPGRWNVPQC